jgi:hypothetical protein
VAAATATAAATAARNGATQCHVEEVVRPADGLLVVLGIQPQTIGLELAWGTTPMEVSCIAYLFSWICFIFACLFYCHA